MEARMFLCRGRNPTTEFRLCEEIPFHFTELSSHVISCCYVNNYGYGGWLRWSVAMAGRGGRLRWCWFLALNSIVNGMIQSQVSSLTPFSSGIGEPPGWLPFFPPVDSQFSVREIAMSAHSIIWRHLPSFSVVKDSPNGLAADFPALFANVELNVMQGLFSCIVILTCSQSHDLKWLHWKHDL